MGTASRIRPLLFAIWVCFVIRGAFYCTIFPLWEGFDEYAHFAYIQHLFENRSLPDPQHTNISAEVEQSLRLAPLPRMMGYLPGPCVTHDNYWKLPLAERERRESALRELRGPRGQGSMVLYEAQQPPLYYLLAAGLYAPIRNLPLPARVQALRLAGLLLASLVIPLAFLIARWVLNSDLLGICVAALIAAMPELMVNLCRVSNEPLALVLATLLILFTIRNRPLAAGITLGLALLTKAYFLAILPAMALIAVARRKMILTVPFALLISGWVYWRNWTLTSSISGVLQDAALADSKASLLGMIPKVNWWSALDSTFLSHIWFGGWSFLQVRSWMYRVFAILFTLALIGLLRRRPKQPITILILFMAALASGVAYHVLLTFAANGSSSSAGWYFYPLVAAEATLLVAGWLAVVPKPAIIPAATACFTALELFGTHFYLIPYYAGFTAPNRALNLSGFRDFGTMLDRLHTPFVLWLAFLAATLGLLVITSTAWRQTASASDHSPGS